MVRMCRKRMSGSKDHALKSMFMKDNEYQQNGIRISFTGTNFISICGVLYRFF